MARGKFADKIANRLGKDNAVGHHLRGKKVTEVLVSGLFALGILALVAVWAAATAGYDTVSRQSPNWNLTDNDHWYAKFIPPPQGPLCQPAFINTGSTFRTTNGIFLWEMGKGFNVSTVNMTGDASPRLNFNATQLTQYSDDVLDHCDVSGATINMDLYQATVTVQLYATCIDPKWPALLYTTNTYSVDPSQLKDDSLWFNNIVVPDPEANASVPDALNLLASDLWYRQRAVWLSSGEWYGRMRGLRMVNGRNCALVAPEAKRDCYDAPLLLTNNTDGFFMGVNLTVSNTDTDEVDWNVTTDNFVNAIFAAARYDFGSNMTTNLFANTTARQQLITRSDAAQLDNSTTLFNTLDGAAAFLDTPVFPALKIARVRTTYQCAVMRIKPTPSFVVTVLASAFAIFGVVFAAAIAIVKKVTGHDLGAKVPAGLAPLAPITSIATNAPRPSTDPNGDETGRKDPEKGHGRAGSSGDFRSATSGSGSDGRFESSRLATPAPSYHMNSRSSDVAYAPLHDRSDDSGPNTPTAVNSSFSSLSGFARGFADKVPFGSHLADKFGVGKISGLPSTSDLSMANRVPSASNLLGLAGAGAAGAGAGGLAAAGVSYFTGAKDKAMAQATQAIPGVSNLQNMMANPMQAAQAAGVPGTANLQNMMANPMQAAQAAGVPGTANLQNMMANPMQAAQAAAVPGTSNQQNMMANPMQAAQAAGVPNMDNAQTMFARPAQAAHIDQFYNATPSSYVPFAYPETIREGGTQDSTPVPGERGASTQAEVHSPQDNPYLPAAAAAGAAGLVGAGAGALWAKSTGTAPGAPVDSTGPVSSRVTSPGPPVGHSSTVPARVTSPGPPIGHSSSVPARVTSPGPPIGHTASVHSRSTSQGPPVGAVACAAAGAGAEGLAAKAAASGSTTTAGPPVGARSAGAPARVTSPGPPLGHTSTVNARVTSAGPPVGARAPAEDSVAHAAPTILAPKPRRAPSPTWLADQDAAASGASTRAQAAPVPTAPASGPVDFSSPPPNPALATTTPASAAGLQGSLADLQHQFNSSIAGAQNTVSSSFNTAVQNAQNAGQQATQAFNSNNPFGK